MIWISRGSNTLRLYDGESFVRSFGVATGQARYPTPSGLWQIVDMQRNPWWRPPDSEWAKGEKPVPPGPGNPLGTRWMGLNAAGVGIHGTPDAASIGYSASHGCIRMQIPDAEWLFTHVSDRDAGLHHLERAAASRSAAFTHSKTSPTTAAGADDDHRRECENVLGRELEEPGDAERREDAQRACDPEESAPHRWIVASLRSTELNSGVRSARPHKWGT